MIHWLGHPFAAFK